MSESSALGSFCQRLAPPLQPIVAEHVFCRLHLMNLVPLSLETSLVELAGSVYVL